MTKKENMNDDSYATYVTACIEKERLEEKFKEKWYNSTLYKDQNKIIAVMKAKRKQIDGFKKRKAHFRELARRSLEDANRLISNAAALQREAESYAKAIKEKKKELGDEDMLGLLNEDLLVDLREDVNPMTVASVF